MTGQQHETPGPWEWPTTDDANARVASILLGGKQQLAQELRAIMLRGYIEQGPDGDYVETQELICDIIRWTHNDPEAEAQVLADTGGKKE